MNKVQEKILDVFKSFKTSKEGILKPQSLTGKVRTWNRKDQDDYEKELNELLNEGYISYTNGYFWLQEKGYNHIYRHYSVNQTEDLILNVIRTHNVGVGHIIITNWFLGPQRDWDRFHFDNFNQAITNVITKGYMEPIERGWKLTQTGYNNIYK